MKYIYDWNEIQIFYDNGGTYRTIRDKFGATFGAITKAVKRGDLITRSISDATNLYRKNNPDKLSHTEETKKKISKSRIKYLLENPDKVPYLLNHYSKGESYPEKYFNDIFNIYHIKLDRYYRINLYELDFAIVDKKIAIEIDGEQHYLDKRITESDKRKDEFLRNNGWVVIRVRWSHYKKLDRESREDFISNLLSKL